jgi:hypothetical protein
MPTNNEYSTTNYKEVSAHENELRDMRENKTLNKLEDIALSTSNIAANNIYRSSLKNLKLNLSSISMRGLL